MTRSSITLLLVFQIVTAGCYHRVEIPKEDLVNHASFSSPENKATFVITKKDGSKSEEFRSLRVQNSQVVGQLKNVKGVEEQTIPISDVKELQRRQFSPEKTSLAVVGGVLGLCALAALLYITALASCGQNCGPS